MLKNIDAEIRFLLWGSCLVYDSFCRKGFVNTSAVTLVCTSEKIYRYKIPLQSFTDSLAKNYALDTNACKTKEQIERGHWATSLTPP